MPLKKRKTITNNCNTESHRDTYLLLAVNTDIAVYHYFPIFLHNHETITAGKVKKYHRVLEGNKNLNTILTFVEIIPKTQLGNYYSKTNPVNMF